MEVASLLVLPTPITLGQESVSQQSSRLSSIDSATPAIRSKEIDLRGAYILENLADSHAGAIVPVIWYHRKHVLLAPVHVFESQ
jgi:hypothetical protein